jgi:hypothetical protein
MLADSPPTPDYFGLSADTLVALAGGLRKLGDEDGAMTALREVLGLYERKGKLVLAGQTPNQLATLRGSG